MYDYGCKVNERSVCQQSSLLVYMFLGDWIKVDLRIPFIYLEVSPHRHLFLYLVENPVPSCLP